jgi:hypothetical protein
MNDFSSWIQNNWYEAGQLLAEFTFLFAGVWFARKILRTLRASQEQFGALLKLTLTDELAERAKSVAAAQGEVSDLSGERPTPYVMADWPAAAETPALTLPGGQRPHSPVAAARRGLIQWLNTPMKSHKFFSWRRIAHWLQAPAGH